MVYPVSSATNIALDSYPSADLKKPDAQSERSSAIATLTDGGNADTFKTAYLQYQGQWYRASSTKNSSGADEGQVTITRSTLQDPRTATPEQRARDLVSGTPVAYFEQTPKGVVSEYGEGSVGVNVDVLLKAFASQSQGDRILGAIDRLRAPR